MTGMRLCRPTTTAVCALCWPMTATHNVCVKMVKSAASSFANELASRLLRVARPASSPQTLPSASRCQRSAQPAWCAPLLVMGLAATESVFLPSVAQWTSFVMGMFACLAFDAATRRTAASIFERRGGALRKCPARRQRPLLIDVAIGRRSPSSRPDRLRPCIPLAHAPSS